FAYSNQDGFQLKNELFIAIAENMDATIGHHYLGNRGVEYQTQYRYIFAPETFGEFNYTHLEPSRDYYDDNSAQWQINGDHFQVFDYNIKSHLHIDKESKNNTNRLYGDDILVRTSAYTDSYFEFNKDYDSSQIDATFQELEQASSQDPNTIVKAPNLSFRKFSEQIGNLPLYFEFDSSIANYQVERDSDINGRFELARLDLFPSLRHSFDLQGAGLLSTTVGARSTSYTNGLAADKSYTDESFSTESYNIGMTYTAPILFKNYQTKSQSISKIRNLIIPTLAYEYLPGGEVDGDDKSKINVIDNVDQDGLSFRNRLTGKLSSVYEGSIKAGQAGNPMYSKKELARIDITQSYNLKVASLEDGDESELPEDRLEPLNVRTLFYPTDWLLLRTDANYNHQNDNFDSSRIEIGYKYDDKFNIAIDRVYDRSLTEDKSSSSLYFGYNLNRRIGADYSLIYGEESSQVRGSIFRLAYKKDCWQLKSSISKKLINGKTETTYGFSIILLGIGDIAAGVGSPILDRKL
ncbi:MAG: LPS assembly protein LptD, partial [Nitrospinota bacterium]